MNDDVIERIRAHSCTWRRLHGKCRGGRAFAPEHVDQKHPAGLS